MGQGKQTAEVAVDTLLEQIPTLKPYETDDVPERYTGVKEVEIESSRYFTVILDGVKRRTCSLRIRHPNPLTVYGIQGMRNASYLAPEDSKFPSADATEVMLTPKDGALTVTSFETVPEERLLESPKATGKTVYQYTDPRVVEVDGRNIPNVKTVRIQGLREAEIKLYMQ